MKAKELSEILNQYPEFDVVATYIEYDDSKTGYASLNINKFNISLGDIGHSSQVIHLDLEVEE